MYNTMLLSIILAGVLSMTSGEINLRRLVQQDNLLKYESLDPDEGHFENCGIAKNFSMKWTPKDLKPRGGVKATLSLIAPFDWASGKLLGEVFMKDLPDTPILKFGQGVTCDEIKKLEPLAKCPYKAQDSIYVTYTEDKLPALPTGQYIISIKLNNSKDQVVICAKGDVNIED